MNELLVAVLVSAGVLVDVLGFGVLLSSRSRLGPVLLWAGGVLVLAGIELAAALAGDGWFLPCLAGTVAVILGVGYVGVMLGRRLGRGRHD